MPGALDDDLQVALGGVCDRTDDVLDGGGKHDDGRAEVGCQVPRLARVVPAAVIGEYVRGDGSWRSWRAPRDGLAKCPEPRTATERRMGRFSAPPGVGRHVNFAPRDGLAPLVQGCLGALRECRGAGSGRRSRTAHRGSRGSTGGARRARRRSRPSPRASARLLLDHRRLAPGALLGEPGDPQQMGARAAVGSPAGEQPLVGHPAGVEHAAILCVATAAVTAFRRDRLLPRSPTPHTLRRVSGSPDRGIQVPPNG